MSLGHFFTAAWFFLCGLCFLWELSLLFYVSPFHLSLLLFLHIRWVTLSPAFPVLLLLSHSNYKRWSPIELINLQSDRFSRWLMSLRWGNGIALTAFSQHKYINDSNLNARHGPYPTCHSHWYDGTLLLFLKCQRQSWIGQDNKHLNKALSLINERWGRLERSLTAWCR